VVDADHHHIAVFRQIGKLVVDRRQRTDAREASAVAVFPRMCRKRTGTAENNLVQQPIGLRSSVLRADEPGSAGTAPAGPGLGPWRLASSNPRANESPRTGCP
jgi:hypothetical protein